MRATWGALLALVVALPTAIAGSDAHPELTDAASDHFQEPDLDGDILSAWFHEDRPNEVEITLKLSTLNERPWGYFEVRGIARHDREPWHAWSVGATQVAAGMVFNVTAVNGRASNDVQGTYALGSPGTIEWRLPYAIFGVDADDQVFLRSAHTSVKSPLERLPWPVDGASSLGIFQVGLADRVKTFDTPLGPPQFTMDNQTSLMAHDVQSLWIQPSDHGTLFTLGTATLDPVAFPKCVAAFVFWVEDSWDATQQEVVVSAGLFFGPNGTRGVEVANTSSRAWGPYPQNDKEERTFTRLGVNVSFGTPGLIQVEVPPEWWNGTTIDLNKASVRVQSLGHGCGASDPLDTEDHFWYFPRHDDFDLPGPGPIVGLAAMAFLALAIRRRHRQD